MPTPDLTRAERGAYGRLERKRRSRSSLGDLVLAPTADRVGAVFAQETDRVQSLLPLRHERMSVSPHAFFRGTAVIMAADLAASPSTKLHAQICGDAHAANFGIFASPERRLVFDLNDFDETYRGPIEWDLKRLAVSLLLAAEESGLGNMATKAVATTALTSYVEHMRAFADMPTLQVWYARLDGRTITAHLDERRAAQMRVEGDKARSRSAGRALQKFVEHDDAGVARFRERPPRLQRLPERDLVEAMVDTYLESLPPEWALLMRRFSVQDLAFKAVGVGSVGTRCLVAVLDSGDPDDLVLIQLKEANRSVLAGHVPGPGPRNQGRRVVVGQKLMQAVGDVLLGWTRSPVTGRDYYVRQLWDMKGDLDISQLGRHGLTMHAYLCGWALARAHARTGDPVAIAGYLGGGGKVSDAVLTYAEQYTAVVHDDYAAFVAAVGDAAPLDESRVDLSGWAD